MSPESILHALLRMARCVFAADHETGTASSARSRVWLALVLLATAASCANDCDGCSCKGSSDVERQRASSARQEPEPSGQATEDPSEEPTADPQNEPAAPTGASGGSGSPFALDERDDPALAAAAGGTTLDRPTSGQVGVVLRDLRAR
ncbi:MAG: hypothetical protein IT379_34975, partial [Deltaproteobacteria bacterium]|nr:hypothetical protein [Deltaproteobacteria bacterium]